MFLKGSDFVSSESSQLGPGDRHILGSVERGIGVKWMRTTARAQASYSHMEALSLTDTVHTEHVPHLSEPKDSFQMCLVVFVPVS